MSIFLFIIIALVLLGLSIKEKKAWPVFLIILCCCYVLMGYNNVNPDYENYELRYDIATYPDGANLLSLLDLSDNSVQAFFKDIGVQDYSQYRSILSGIIFLLFGWFISRECQWRNVFMAIYILCYLLLDIVQIRNFEAFIILLPFIPLLAKRNLKYTLIYVSGVLLSATFHFSTIFFLLFAFINIKSRKVRVLLILLLMLVLLPIATFISDSAAASRVDDYTRSGVLGALLGISFVLLNYFIIRRICKISLINTTWGGVRSINSTLSTQFILELNFMLLMIIPFFFINATTGRLLRYTSLLNVMYILNTMASITSGKTRVKLVSALILYLAYFAIF